MIIKMNRQLISMSDTVCRISRMSKPFSSYALGWSSSVETNIPPAGQGLLTKRIFRKGF